jgi:hypothetical protein
LRKDKGGRIKDENGKDVIVFGQLPCSCFVIMAGKTCSWPEKCRGRDREENYRDRGLRKEKGKRMKDKKAISPSYGFGRPRCGFGVSDNAHKDSFDSPVSFLTPDSRSSGKDSPPSMKAIQFMIENRFKDKTPRWSGNAPTVGV